jgi:hypothetical protein
MKRAVIGLLVWPLLASGASAADRLSDLQLDIVTAGQILGVENCGGCTLTSSTSQSSDGNPSTTTTTVSIIGSGGGTTTTTVGGGGATGGGSTTGGAPTVVTSIPIPTREATILANASTVMVIVQ